MRNTRPHKKETMMDPWWTNDGPRFSLMVKFLRDVRHVTHSHFQ
jgi:hypothetical protein